MSRFLFITDLQIKASNNVRTGDYLTDICAKLEWVVHYANSIQANIIIGGDIFDKPSVPDLVKSKLIRTLINLNDSLSIYSIQGNHDSLWNSSEYNFKTSYGLMCDIGLFKDFTDSTIVLDDVVLSNQLPVKNQTLPQIFVYHGFLNVEDGKWTFRYQDIESTVKNQTYVLLGHDHVEYDPLQFNEQIQIFRPGSFARVTREEPSMRQPKLLEIRVEDGKMKRRFVEIPARPFTEIFFAKQTTVTKSQQRETYEDVIAQIKNANVQNMSFKDALESVASEDVCNYVFKSLEEKRYENQHNSKNL